MVTPFWPVQERTRADNGCPNPAGYFTIPAPLRAIPDHRVPVPSRRESVRVRLHYSLFKRLCAAQCFSSAPGPRSPWRTTTQTEVLYHISAESQTNTKRTPKEMKETRFFLDMHGGGYNRGRSGCRPSSLLPAGAGFREARRGDGSCTPRTGLSCAAQALW